MHVIFNLIVWKVRVIGLISLGLFKKISYKTGQQNLGQGSLNKVINQSNLIRHLQYVEHVSSHL